MKSRNGPPLTAGRFLFSLGFLWSTISIAQTGSFLGRTATDAIRQAEHKEFAGVSDYQAVPQSTGPAVICGESRASASALIWRQSIDLGEQPIVQWRWRIEQDLPSRRLQSKAGDDFAVRLYFLHRYGPLPWQIQALNYVGSTGWSVATDDPQSWPNPFAGDKAIMLGLPASSQWQTVRRNVRQDFLHYTGRDVTRIDAVAIMVDSDNSRSQAKGCFAQIEFSAAGRPKPP